MESILRKGNGMEKSSAKNSVSVSINGRRLASQSERGKLRSLYRQLYGDKRTFANITFSDEAINEILRLKKIKKTAEQLFPCRRFPARFLPLAGLVIGENLLSLIENCEFFYVKDNISRIKELMAKFPAMIAYKHSDLYTLFYFQNHDFEWDVLSHLLDEDDQRIFGNHIKIYFWHKIFNFLPKNDHIFALNIKLIAYAIDKMGKKGVVKILQKIGKIAVSNLHATILFSVMVAYNGNLPSFAIGDFDETLESIETSFDYYFNRIDFTRLMDVLSVIKSNKQFRFFSINWNQFKESNETIEQLIENGLFHKKIEDKDFLLPYDTEAKKCNPRTIVPVEFSIKIDSISTKLLYGTIVPANSSYNYTFGEHVVCCQSLGGQAENCCYTAMESPNACTFAVFSGKQLVGGCFLWIDQSKQIAVIDNIEAHGNIANLNDFENVFVQLTQQLNNHGLNVYVGAHYTKMKKVANHSARKDYNLSSLSPSSYNHDCSLAVSASDLGWSK
jgi:hypothetical protein